MRAVIGALLSAALLLGPAHSLTCYLCSETSGKRDCITQTCSINPASCSKIPVNGASPIATGCTLSHACGRNPLGIEVECCTTDLCNGATSARISYALLALAVGGSALLLLLPAGI